MVATRLHTPMHKHMALWIRGCLINVRIQSIARSHVTGLPLLLHLSHSSLPLLSVSCHLPFLCLPYRFFCSSSSLFNLPYALKSPRRAHTVLVNTHTHTQKYGMCGWKHQLPRHREKITALSKDFASSQCYVLSCSQSEFCLLSFRFFCFFSSEGF